MDLIWWIVIIIVLVLVGILFWLWSFYNRIIRSENRIDNAWGQIDVQLKRRADLIPNLMETVKGYMKHERETLEAVTKARTLAQQVASASPGERGKGEGEAH